MKFYIRADDSALKFIAHTMASHENTAVIHVTGRDYVTIEAWRDVLELTSKLAELGCSEYKFKKKGENE